MAALTLETLNERVSELEDEKEGLLAIEKRLGSIVKDNDRANDHTFADVRKEIADTHRMVKAIIDHFKIQIPEIKPEDLG